jgi:hypothetical protein
MCAMELKRLWSGDAATQPATIAVPLDGSTVTLGRRPETGVEDTGTARAVVTVASHGEGNSSLTLTAVGKNGAIRSPGGEWRTLEVGATVTMRAGDMLALRWRKEDRHEDRPPQWVYTAVAAPAARAIPSRVAAGGGAAAAAGASVGGGVGGPRLSSGYSGRHADGELATATSSFDLDGAIKRTKIALRRKNEILAVVIRNFDGAYGRRVMAESGNVTLESAEGHVRFSSLDFLAPIPIVGRDAHEHTHTHTHTHTPTHTHTHPISQTHLVSSCQPRTLPSKHPLVCFYAVVETRIGRTHARWRAHITPPGGGGGGGGRAPPPPPPPPAQLCAAHVATCK